jgi:hypothetical protein
MDLMVMLTSWLHLASWRTRLAFIKVSFLAVIITDWRNENLLERSGLIFIIVY